MASFHHLRVTATSEVSSTQRDFGYRFFLGVHIRKIQDNTCSSILIISASRKVSESTNSGKCELAARLKVRREGLPSMWLATKDRSAPPATTIGAV